MFCIGVGVTDVDKHYKMEQPTVSNILRRFRDKGNNGSKIKKMGCPCKLSGRGMRVFKKYVSDNCFDPLYTIVAKFSENSGIQISERSGRRYIRKLKLKNCIAIQKPFLSSRNIKARIMWARIHQSWTLKHGLTLRLQMSLVLLYARLRVVSEYGENVDKSCIKNTLFLRLSPAIKQCSFGMVSQCVDAPRLLVQLDHSIGINILQWLATISYHLCMMPTAVLLHFYYRKTIVDPCG